MAAKRDNEFLILKLTDAIKAGLNAKIAAITVEKNDGLELPTINDDAYSYIDMGVEMGNHDPFVLFTISSTIVDNDGGSSVEAIIIGVEMWLSQTLLPTSRDVFKYISRYRRAVREIASDQNEDFYGFKILGLPTIGFQENNIVVFGTGVGIQIGNAHF